MMSVERFTPLQKNKKKLNETKDRTLKKDRKVVKNFTDLFVYIKNTGIFVPSNNYYK